MTNKINVLVTLCTLVISVVNVMSTQMKKIKKATLIIFCLWFLLFCVRFIFSKIDYDRVNNGLKPILAFGFSAYKDGGTVTYDCFGYSLTRLYRFRFENGMPIGYDVGPIIKHNLNWLFFSLEDKQNINFVPREVLQ